jgi:hypothetical protein
MSNRGTGATREGDGYTAGKWIGTESELPTRRLTSEAVSVAWLLCLLFGNAQMPLGLSNKYGYAKSL